MFRVMGPGKVERPGPIVTEPGPIVYCIRDHRERLGLGATMGGRFRSDEAPDDGNFDGPRGARRS